MLVVSMPNFATSAAFVDTATKCFATAPSSPSVRSAHSRALRAFVMVSRVVNVFEDTMNRVSAASTSRVAATAARPRCHEGVAFDVRYNRERHVAGAVVSQRLVRHDRSEVRSADAD